MSSPGRNWLAATALAASLAAGGAEAQPLTVCMAEDNPPLSYRTGDESRGLDVRVAAAIAAELGRTLKVIPFESKYEHESTLSQEVNALLSSGVCEMASGFALIASDLGAPARPTARVPDYPGAKRPPQRPWVPLGTLVASRPYHAMAMALVVRDPARESATLAEPGNARIGVISGTLAGTVASLYRNGKLRPQLVSLTQNQNVLEQLEADRFDAALIALDRLDAWHLAHPASPIRRAAYTHPLRINIGFVALRESTGLVGAADRLIDRATASGELQRWSQETGTTWVAPGEPAIAGAIGLADLVRE
jgi:ABC-type amino acid transport substrate-binding protein